MTGGAHLQLQIYVNFRTALLSLHHVALWFMALWCSAASHMQPLHWPEKGKEAVEHWCDVSDIKSCLQGGLWPLWSCLWALVIHCQAFQWPSSFQPSLNIKRLEQGSCFMKGRAGIGVLLVLVYPPPFVAVFLEGVCVSLSIFRQEGCRTVQIWHTWDLPQCAKMSSANVRFFIPLSFFPITICHLSNL